LQVFAFQENLRAYLLVQTLASENRCAVGIGLYAFCRLADVVQSWLKHIHHASIDTRKSTIENRKLN
jgi:hypothetical protein